MGRSRRGEEKARTPSPLIHHFLPSTSIRNTHPHGERRERKVKEKDPLGERRGKKENGGPIVGRTLFLLPEPKKRKRRIREPSKAGEGKEKGGKGFHRTINRFFLASIQVGDKGRGRGAQGVRGERGKKGKGRERGTGA